MLMGYPNAERLAGTQRVACAAMRVVTAEQHATMPTIVMKKERLVGK